MYRDLNFLCRFLDLWSLTKSELLTGFCRPNGLVRLGSQLISRVMGHGFFYRTLYSCGSGFPGCWEPPTVFTGVSKTFPRIYKIYSCKGISMGPPKVHFLYFWTNLFPKLLTWWIVPISLCTGGEKDTQEQLPSLTHSTMGRFHLFV